MRDELFNKAKLTLKANLVNTDQGPMIAAGGGHFRSLWVRDFAYSVPGLLRAGHVDTVKNQLRVIHRFISDKGQIPRGLDVANPKVRVLWNLFLKRNPDWMSYPGRKMRPEYYGEHSTPAYDSNLVFILAASAQEGLFDTEKLRALLSYYQFEKDGLLHQPPYSDWQDSARRKGPVLLTHLLYLAAAIRLNLKAEAENARAVICENFSNATTGLFNEFPNENFVALDSHLFLLKNDLGLGKTREIYQRLRRHPVWTSSLIPGLPIYPHYGWREVSWTTKLVGLRRYHDGLIWGWLAADAYICARRQDDNAEAERILKIFGDAHRDQEFLCEVYRGRDGELLPFRSALYRSESPFTWTAAKWTEALA